jgi:hypothetical protein
MFLVFNTQKKFCPKYTIYICILIIYPQTKFLMPIITENWLQVFCGLHIYFILVYSIYFLVFYFLLFILLYSIVFHFFIFIFYNKITLRKVPSFSLPTSRIISSDKSVLDNKGDCPKQLQCTCKNNLKHFRVLFYYKMLINTSSNKTYLMLLNMVKHLPAHVSILYMSNASLVTV